MNVALILEEQSSIILYIARHLCSIKIGLFNVYDFISPIKDFVVIPLVVVFALTIILSLKSCFSTTIRVNDCKENFRVRHTFKIFTSESKNALQWLKGNTKCILKQRKQHEIAQK